MRTPPSKTTLRRYGLSAEEWQQMWTSQGECCPICKRTDAPIVIDHEHAPRWRKMPPEKRKLYVRGLVCSYCNQRRIGKGVTTATAYNAYWYLREYEARKPK